MQMELTLEQQRFELEKQMKLLDAQLKREEHRARMTMHAVKAAISDHGAGPAASESAVAPRRAAAHESIGPDRDGQAPPGSDSGAGGSHEPASAASSSNASAALIAGLMDTLHRMSAPKRARKLPDGSWVTELVETHADLGAMQ